MTKGDARRKLWSKHLFLLRVRKDVVKMAVEKAIKDIQEEEDRITLKSLYES